MKLTEKAIKKINNARTRMDIAMALGVTDQHIYKGIRTNRNDGFLTKANVLRIIQQETGLKESDILQEDDEVVIHKRVRVGRQSKSTI